MLDDDIDQERMAKIRENGTVFVREVLGEEPYDYQSRFLDTDKRRRCFVAGRQVGKSTVMIWLAIWKWATNTDHDVLIFSPSQRQAIEFFSKLRDTIDVWIDNPEEYGITYETKTEIHGANNSRIVALTAAGSGETIRGYTTDTVMIDEAAFIETDFYTSVISPMLLRTEGDFILCGTPWGQSGFFYDKFHDDRWLSLQVPTLECPDVSMDVIEEMEDDLSRIEYKREVLGEFAEKPNAAFPEEVIKPAIYHGDSAEDVFPPRGEGPCYLGVDPARYGGDRAVFTSVDDFGNVFDVDVKSTCSIPEIENIVRRLDNERGYEKILVDENGVGGGAFDHLLDMPHVEAMKFTLQSKQEIYQNFKRLLEDGLVQIPDKKDLIGELRDMEYEEMRSGNVKFHAPDDGRDDFCFVAGTGITTPDGQTPIEELEVGDFVLTRDGYKPITGTGSRESEVITRHGLTGTPDHPVITENGTRQLDSVRASELKWVWNEKPSNITETYTTAIRNQNTAISGSITGVSSTPENRLLHSTVRNTETNTARSPKDTKSTTRTVIPSITMTGISKRRMSRSICESIWKRDWKMENTGKNSTRILPRLEKRLLNGTGPRKAVGGMRSITRILKKLFTKRDIPINASNVESLITLIGRRKPVSVQSLAKTSGITTTSEYGENVKFAAKNLTAINTRIRNAVPKAVPQNSDINGESTTTDTVYNISVADKSEYFANGILVHNCDSAALAFWARSQDVIADPASRMYSFEKDSREEATGPRHGFGFGS